ncbi:SusC/RagA family TonB-linked outer membrane protein [uncultured Mucilaginibacter sp.]|uniref:SusC/RagA family TonB-linked outer membrane protein n=1 Tax=uncultured Mucilaginibacter sp. TaxID=797541 RepID=UPI0025CFCCDA|nr:SusC/RagA family TonB-linked outer membrane protein [uncultured Mucilaginibacter sp.]
MKRLLLVSLCMLCLCVTQLYAQSKTVTGTVTAKDDGLPLPGVSVSVKGTTTGTQANGDGKFTITAPNGATLVFSFIGYKTQEVAVGSGSTVNVSLETASTQLGEVVITGALGIQRPKKEIGYAATVVNNETITAGNAVNLANGLQGKVSGLNITSANNGVFENVKINLRGIRSLTGNNNPLLLIDGLQTDINYLSSINPNDIENVNVLKGSAGAAVYGPDARNGVIVVTTKKGTRDDKPVVTVGNSTQFQKISFFPKFQNSFGSGGAGEYIPYENWSWGPAFDGSTVELGHELSDGTVQTTDYSAKNDRKKFFNTGRIIQNDVSIAAKNFFLSLQDANINGIVPEDKNRRTGIRLNTSREYGRFKVGLNTNYIQQNYNVFDDLAMEDYNTANNVGLNGGLMNLIFNTPAHVPLTSYKDFRNNQYAQFNNYFNDYGLNPYFAIDNWRKVGKRQDLLLNLDMNLKVTDWLNVTYRAGLNSQNITERRLSEGETPNAYGLDRSFKTIPGRAEERSYYYQRLSSELFATFNKQINEDFKVGAILGTYVRQDESRDTRVGATLVVPELYNISQRVGLLTGSSPFSRNRLFSYYGTANVSYKGWANLELTGRNDRVSVLDPSNNSFFYPGATASIVVSDAFDFFKNNDAISYFKIRGAINKTGNADIASYLLLPTYNQPAGYPFGSLPGYTAGNSITDANLKPEFTVNSEFGFEMSFLRNRINLEATYFHQKNTDQIIPTSISSATGFTGYTLNAASFTNKGFELDLGLTPIVRIKDVSINLKANATYNDTEITKIAEGLDELFIGGYTNAANYAIKGSPAFLIKGSDYNRDPQGRVIVSSTTGLPTQNPITKPYGRTLPKWILGLNPYVKYKSLNVSALFEYKGGYYAYHNIGPDMAWTGVSEASASNNRQPFVFPNSSILVNGQYVPNTGVTLNSPETFYTGVYRNVSSNFITSAAAWRLREVSITYDLPVAKLFGNQKVIKALNVGLTGRNLVLWLPKTNVYTDPDFTFQNGATTGVVSGNTAGISNSQINPPVRTFGGNITVTF